MTTSALIAPLERTRQSNAVFIRALVVVLSWWGVFGIMVGLPDIQQGFAPLRFGEETNTIFLLLAIAVSLFAATAVLFPQNKLAASFKKGSAWLIALAIFSAIWELSTAKLAWLPPPFFAPPRTLVEAYVTDWPKLLDSVGNSMLLLFFGFLYGSVTGFITGIAIGWSHGLGYWVHPVLRFLGPVPSTALLPISMFFFPTSFSAAVFLIALATWFPVTVLTWSGVSSVDKRYYDVARTLGASQLFLILRVAIPASLPHVFVGLFMGLGASFSVLVPAEMMGVKSGLGWYLQWAQGWAAYSNMYGALIVMAILFSSLITLLFTVRDRILSWQSNAVKW